MGEIIELQENRAVVPEETKDELCQAIDSMLAGTGVDLVNRQNICVPIASLTSLGAVVSSLVPALQAVMNDGGSGIYYVNTNGQQMFRKKGSSHFIGGLKDAAGKVGGGQADLTRIPLDPTTFLIAASLYAIEQKLNVIEETQQQILNFLACEKESEIEADLQMLSGIIMKYKFNWDNEHYVASNHKLVLDIQRKALMNVRIYQKQVSATLEKKQLLVAQNNVKGIFSDLQKKFQYYRMALYTYSLASLLEIMLGGNFKEGYISTVKTEIEQFALDYRNFFEKASVRLEQMATGAIDTKALKGLGKFSQSAGKFIGSIPVIRKGPVDEMLQAGGTHLSDKASGIEEKAVHNFAALGNPGTLVLTERMQELIQIYNHTEQICFDREHIYLVGETA